MRDPSGVDPGAVGVQPRRDWRSVAGLVVPTAVPPAPEDSLAVVGQAVATGLSQALARVTARLPSSTSPRFCGLTSAIARLDEPNRAYAFTAVSTMQGDTTASSVDQADGSRGTG